MFRLNCCERKTLFRLKKEAEQAEYGVSRTGPMLHSYGIDVIRSHFLQIGHPQYSFRTSYMGQLPLDWNYLNIFENSSIQKGPKAQPNFNWYIFIAKCWIGDGAFNLSNCLQFVLWLLIIYFSGIKLELVYMHDWIIKLH